MAEKSCNAGGGKEEEEAEKTIKGQNENRKVCWLCLADLKNKRQSKKTERSAVYVRQTLITLNVSKYNTIWENFNSETVSIPV